MQRIPLLSAAAAIAVCAAAPLTAQTVAPTAPVTVPATNVPAPAPEPSAVPATTVGPAAREAAVEPEAEAKPAKKAKSTTGKSTDGSKIRGNLGSTDPKPKPKAKDELAVETDTAATADAAPTAAADPVPVADTPPAATTPPAVATQPVATTPPAAATPPAPSQGEDNASVTGLANASPASALGAAGNVDLNSVAGGTAVIGTGGTSIGTVTGRVKNKSGATVGLQVKLADGTTATIPASQLSLSGTSLTTDWVAKK